MIFGRSEVSTTTQRYIESSFTKPPFSKVFYSNKHGATWRNVHLLSLAGRSWSGGQDENCHSGVSSQLGWWVSAWPSGEKAMVAVHRMVLTWLWKKAEMSPFPQSIFIQVGPGAHFVAVPTCKERSRVERESYTFHCLFSLSFKLIRLPD